MSRVGRMPIVVPSGVELRLQPTLVAAKGPKGSLEERIPPFIQAALKDGQLLLTADLASSRDAKALYGTVRARINNMVQGVARGFSKGLEIVGLGYRAEVAGQKLTLSLGHSHPVVFEAPAGVVVAVDAKKTLITLSGASKELVGQTAAKLRALKKPEPYKGTGIRYQGEHVRKKAGKAAAGAAGAAAGGAGGAKK